MPLNLSMFYAVVRVIGDVPDGRVITARRRGTIGSGFLVAVPSEDAALGRYGYVVTAHHVIADQTKVEIEAPDPLNHGEFQPREEVVDWRQPLPDVDLVLAPFNGIREAADGGHYGGLVVDQIFLPTEYVPDLGATVYYIGTLEPLNQPMARKGALGALYVRGLKHQGGYEYEPHLLDVRSYRGFSGSPCFAEFAVPNLTAEPLPERFARYMPSPEEPRGTMEYHSSFCGMVTEHLEHADEETEAQAVSRFGVAEMLPSAYVWAALYHPDLVEERKGWDEMNRKRLDQSQPVFRTVSITPPPADEEDEFSRFRELTRQLINTPKPGKDGEPSPDAS